ncbi:MAG TPA: hypothetical protein PLK35_02310 [Candidatus Moranbacteria bacterium]|nr:hypothetical protein [Candidatus Moranbacteria bacterium]
MINPDEKSKNSNKSLKDKIKLFFKNEYFQNKTNSWLLFLSLLADLINWAVLVIFLRTSTSNIILHYNVYFGVDMIGNWKQTLLLPAIGLVIFAINFLLSRYFYFNKEKVASYILLAATFMAQTSLLIAALGVIIINY